MGIRIKRIHKQPKGNTWFPRSEQITKGTTKTIKMMPIVLLGLVAVAAAVPMEFAREEPQVNKEENLIPIYKPGFSYVNHNLFAMYNPFERSMRYDPHERQVLPYRHYYSKEQSPLVYKRNYFARYLDLDEPEYYQNDEYYPYDQEMSFYKHDYNIRHEQPTYNYYKKYFTIPYSQEYFYNIPQSYKYAHLYNPYSYSQQYKQYYNFNPYIRQHQQYDSLYHPHHHNQYYHYYPLINKQRSVEYVKPTAYDYMMYRNVLPHEQSRELPLDTTVSKRFLVDTTPVQHSLIEKVDYVNKDLSAGKLIETPIERKVVVQMQPIVSKTLQSQPIVSKALQNQLIVGKPIAQEHEQRLVGKSLSYDQETGTYYRPLTYGQQNLISKPLTYESLPSVGKILPYQQESIVENSQIYNQQPIVSQGLEQSQQAHWGKVLYPSQAPSKSYLYTYENEPIGQAYIRKEQPALGKIFDNEHHQLMQGQEYNNQQSLVKEQIAQDEHYQPIYGKGLLYDQYIDNVHRRYPIA